MTSQKKSQLTALFAKVLTSVTVLPNILLPNILRIRNDEKKMCVVPLQVERKINRFN
jgi:hypothetical protein